MSSPVRYATPTALSAAITAKAKQSADTDAASRGLVGRAARDFVGERLNQLRRDVAFHAALRRLSLPTSQGAWVIKGGVALQLRLDPSRPSKDIDITWMGEVVDRAVELDALRTALERDEDDFFAFQLDTAGDLVDEAGALVVPVVARLGGRHFERFSIDLAPAREGLKFDEMPSVSAPLGIEQLGEAHVRLLQIELQVADKLCAIHETRNGEPSSRWRDLADVAMIAQQIDDVDGRRLVDALVSEAGRRTTTLPDGLPDRMTLTTKQQREWSKQWGRGGRSVPISFEHALAMGQDFADPILSGRVTSGTWRSGAWK